MDKQVFPAHISEEGIQTCETHCFNTAQYARDDLGCISLGESAYLAGILHDCGKFTEAFSRYITDSADGKQARRGSVIHSFAGASYLLTSFHDSENVDAYERLTSELLAYAVGAHHGLFDCVDENKRNGFIHRLTKQPEYDKKAISAFQQVCQTEEDLIVHFNSAKQEIINTYSILIGLVSNAEEEVREEECAFYIGLLARLLSSAVIDGDRRDTASFMAGTSFSPSVAADGVLWKSCRAHLESVLAGFSTDTEIQKARHEISSLCLRFANEEPGIFRLNVPTGGGKTLSALRYALAHAEKFGKRRIVYTAPLISILDQNAAVIREAVGDDRLVLEHHSNVIRPKDEGSQSRYDLLADTWDIPIVVTTLVQLLNTFFSGKTACVRRFQSLCDSVIIIDEVQSVPTSMLSMFNLTINFLSDVMGATVVLCSATQPCLESLPHRMQVSEKEMIDSQKYATLSKAFQRTKLVDRGSVQAEALPVFVQQVLEETMSLLIICNTKDEAAKLFCKLDGECARCFHLSASMCMAHRKRTLSNLNDALRTGEKVICVSTQVIEAGVDISFGAVIRLTAGIDNIVQAAGRCNRNGEQEALASVYIVRLLDERLGKLPEVKNAQDASNQLLEHFKSNPERFDYDLYSSSSVSFYYRTLYENIERERGGHFDFPIKGTKLFDLLSINSKYVDGSQEAEGYLMWQAFKTAGSLFEVFDRDAETVIIPYEEGTEVVAELSTERAKHDIVYIKDLLDRAKDYSVSVHRWQMEAMLQVGAIKVIETVCDGRVFVLQEHFYGRHVGLQMEPVDEEESEWSTQIL